ncbi:MAG TPA: hypothetical protein EYG73_08080 [Arcobacter sp.]|nr:hypothetical protein [Arcobacter sp.]
MKKCTFLNPDRGEFLIWFFLGVGITSVIWLIVFVVPLPKEYTEIVKDGLSSAITVIIAIPSVILVLCQMKQEQLIQRQTNTLQLIDNTLYNHFEKINSQIESIKNKASSDYERIKEKIPFDTQYDNIGTEDVEPNDNYTEAEKEKYQIQKERNQSIDKILDDFFKFIYDIEIKIEYDIVDENLIKIYFKDKIENIFIAKTKTKLSLENDIDNIVLVNDFKREKVVNLSQRWYGKNYIEIKELLKD